MNPPKFFDHQLTENVKLLHKAVVKVNNKVLILRRALDSQSRPGCWDLPGGNSQWPAPTQASASDLHCLDVAREIVEETGLTVPAEKFTFNNLVYLSSYFDSQKQIYTVIFGWLAPYQADQDAQQNSAFPEIKISEEHIEFAWIDEKELANYDFGGLKGGFVVDIIKATLAKQS